jgi:hypothetical protein
MKPYSYSAVKHSPLFNFLPQGVAAIGAHEGDHEGAHEGVHLGVGAMMPNDLPVLMLSEMAQLDEVHF